MFAKVESIVTHITIESEYNKFAVTGRKEAREQFYGGADYEEGKSAGSQGGAVRAGSREEVT